jgi:hypothetical protein
VGLIDRIVDKDEEAEVEQPPEEYLHLPFTSFYICNLLPKSASAFLLLLLLYRYSCIIVG